MSTVVEEAFPHQTMFLHYIKEDDISSFQSFFRDMEQSFRLTGVLMGYLAFQRAVG
jgi:hypothetical protein